MKWGHYKMNKLRENDNKNQIFYRFDAIININDINSKIIKLDKKLYKNIFIYCNGNEASNGVKPFYITFNKTNGYIENINESIYIKQ